MLIASLLFCSWFCLAPALTFLYDTSLPKFQFKGRITAVHVRNSTEDHYSAYIRIHTDSGGEIRIHSSDQSVYLRLGERVKVRYRGDTGDLIIAYFYAPDGKQEGVLQGTSNLGRILLLLIGLSCIWASIRKYRRDPEGAEQSPDASSPISILRS